MIKSYVWTDQESVETRRHWTHFIERSEDSPATCAVVCWGERRTRFRWSVYMKCECLFLLCGDFRWNRGFWFVGWLELVTVEQPCKCRLKWGETVELCCIWRPCKMTFLPSFLLGLLDWACVLEKFYASYVWQIRTRQIARFEIHTNIESNLHG